MHLIHCHHLSIYIGIREGKRYAGGGKKLARLFPIVPDLSKNFFHANFPKLLSNIARHICKLIKLFINHVLQRPKTKLFEIG
jgi:hypothetical protein